MNPLPKFFELLKEAHAASEAVDQFDLRTEDPVSFNEWSVLLAAQSRHLCALTQYCADHADAIMEMIGMNGASTISRTTPDR